MKNPDSEKKYFYKIIMIMEKPVVFSCDSKLVDEAEIMQYAIDHNLFHYHDDPWKALDWTEELTQSQFDTETGPPEP